MNAEEESRRFELFKATFQKIQEHNATPGRTFTQGINQFSDQTAEEKSRRFGVKPNPSQS